METMLAMVISLAGVSREDTAVTHGLFPPDASNAIEPGVEALYEQNESELDHLELLDRLQWLQENPFDLNTAREDELLLVPGITAEEAHTIVTLRDRVGTFTSIAQLAVADEIGEDVAGKLHAYVFVKAPVDRKAAPVSPPLHVRTRMIRDLQPRRGFTEGRYSGSSIKTYSRVAMHIHDNIRSGVLMTKDAGEQFSTGFLSGFVEARLGSSRVLAGDFTMEAGQGLVFWSGAAFGKGSDAVHAGRKSGMGPRPYRSSSESGFFRGAAATTAVDVSEMNLSVTAFVSRRNLSATLNDDGTFSSFYDAGLFRTGSEITKRNTVRETVVGGRAGLSGTGPWNAGINYYHSAFDRTLNPSSPVMFSGKTNDIAGADASVRVGRGEVFGEIALSGRRGKAGLLGGTITVSRSTRLALIYRDYGASFDHAHASAFGERSNTNNETGLYLAVQSSLSRSVKITGYLDHFKFRLPTATLPLPASGTDMLFESDVRLNPVLSLTGRYSRKVVQSGQPWTDGEGRDARIVVDRASHRARLTVIYAVSRSFRLRGRWEGTQVRYPVLRRAENGYLFFQDLRYRSGEDLTLEFRMVFFETDSFDSRLYEYENDLRGVFSNPALYGRGRRWYVLARYGINDALGLSMKYAETQKEGVTSIGSGTSEVTGDLDNRLSMQLDWRW